MSAAPITPLRYPGTFRYRLRRLRAWLPEGRVLQDRVWQRRHHGILILLWLHVAALPVVALARHYSLAHGLLDASLVAVPTTLAGLGRGGRRLRSVLATFGLVMASAVLVHLTGGLIEVHFHYFVVVGIITLYQDWTAFLCAVLFVVINHGLMGVIDAHGVYNHPEAIAHPWTWAAIHGAFLLSASIANLVCWRNVEFQSLHDPLTECANRQLFRERLDQAWLSGSEHLAVLFIDLDGFKRVNDRLGHAAGDAVLVEVADRIKATVRPGDLVARLGGDEFTVLLPDITSIVTAEQIAERVLAALREPHRLGNAEVRATASVGIAISPHNRRGEAGLLHEADLAMYIAKTIGKDSALRFHPEMERLASERAALEADLRLALDRDEFVVEYQPIVDLDGGTAMGVEALVRWDHPTQGRVGPAVFVPLAEETGLINALGHVVLSEACTQAARWQRHGPLFLTVNIAVAQLQTPDFAATVADVLERSGFPPQRLILEITERTFVDDMSSARAVLHRLQSLGVRIAIDDFGTGFSALKYLNELPVDILKVDRDFVAKISADPEESALARALIQLAQTMHLGVIAEGIESAAQADELRARGCQFGQGFHYAHPVPADVISTLLASQLAPSPALDTH